MPFPLHPLCGVADVTKKNIGLLKSGLKVLATYRNGYKNSQNKSFICFFKCTTLIKLKQELITMGDIKHILHKTKVNLHNAKWSEGRDRVCREGGRVVTKNRKIVKNLWGKIGNENFLK